MVELSATRSNNDAEKQCAIKKLNYLYFYLGKDNFYGQEIGLKCDIKKANFALDIENFNKIEKKIKKYQTKKRRIEKVELNWHKESSSSLTKQFNISTFINLFTYLDLDVDFRNLHRIELNLFDNPFYRKIRKINLINSDLTFTINGKIVKTCSDITSAQNGTFKIASLFQISLSSRHFILFGCRFPLTLCPLVFSNSKFRYFKIVDLVDTFYKKNLLKFSNETWNNLNSEILSLSIFNSENIALDTAFLNPYVFENLIRIYIFCSLNSISMDLFASLKSLFEIIFQTIHFRKLIHRNGIEWIKGINRGLHVNLSNLSDFKDNFDSGKYVSLSTEIGLHIEPISEIFPDEDFCVYRDYPFDQMVFTRQLCSECDNPIDHRSFEYLKSLNPSYTCTYMWINRYYHLEMYVLSNESLSDLFLLLDSDSYKNIKKCNFERRISLCNRSHYRVKDIWGPLDYYILNKKIQIGVKLLTYLLAIFSSVTNILVIRIIFVKHNEHVFKDFKHYTYLGLISVFSLCISLIEIISWLSECFYPYEVFCLGVHKTIVAQLFKMVIKECLVITLRFLTNFCYIAFAFNRIALIGRDHGKLIKFMSELAIWKYILVSLIISIFFSWIKYFKYSINFDLEELKYPIWNERDISTPGAILPSILDFYMVFNVISDLFNYLVLVILCFVVDLTMLVRLRSTVNESIDRIKSMSGSNEKQFEKKKSELEDTVKKSIRMVVLNTSIGLLLKLPLVFLPLVNAIGTFFYKDTYTQYKKRNFDRFYTQLFDVDFYSLIQDSTELLFLISLSIQFFVYKKFDKKFNEGTLSPPPSKNKNQQK